MQSAENAGVEWEDLPDNVIDEGDGRAEENEGLSEEDLVLGREWADPWTVVSWFEVGHVCVCIHACYI